MKTWSFGLLIVLVGCFSACKESSTSHEEVSTEKSFRVLPYDRYFYDLSEAGRFSGSVLVALPDTVFEQSYRMTGAPEEMNVSSSRPYPIGEINQLLLRATYFKLADQGRITLNGPVSSYLASLPQSASINYRMLLDHRAGIPETMPASGKIADIELISTPGAEEHYSALNYALLAKALSEHLGVPVSEAIRVNVLEPAGMTRTGVLNLESPPSNLAVGYTDASGAMERVSLLDFTPIDQERSRRPSEILDLPEYYSTISDLFYLSQWMPESAFLKGEVKQPAVRPGYRSYFYASLQSGETHVVLSNFGGTDLKQVVKGMQGN